MLGTAIGGLSLTALGIYGAREGTRLGRVLLERCGAVVVHAQTWLEKTADLLKIVEFYSGTRYLGKPELVRETSKQGLSSLASLFGLSGRRNAKGILSDVVLSTQLDSRVRMLASTIANTRANGAPFRNLLFYGPPGNGKTMIARRLATLSGLDYAIMSGGECLSLGVVVKVIS